MGKWKNRFWIIPPLVIGIAAILSAQLLKKPPQKAEVAERAVTARAIKISKIDVLPHVIGYGTTRPGRTWEAVTEVSGRVIWISDNLKNGNLIAKDDELLRIDDSEYRLLLEQIEAQLNASRIKDRTTEASIAIEERSLKLQKSDLKNKQSLVGRGAVAETTVDAAKQQVYAAEAKLQNLHNAKAINAAESKVLEAQKALAEFNLSRTLLKAPFDVRITDVKANLAQYANKGQLLFSADGTDTAEIEAQIPIGKLRPLIGEDKPTDLPATGPKKPGAMKLDAIVRLKTGTHDIEWQARVDRVAGTIDPQTQTLGIVVAVDDPYLKSSPGKRPPLIRNTFVEVELKSKVHPEQIAIPTAALHEGKIYVLNEENRLEIRPVKIKYSLGEVTVIAKGLKPGERILVSDLIPAIDGMLINAKEDKKTKKRLVMLATGKEPKQ